ncbi:MAG: hypothetical protein IT210_26515 [Armatimonadetes bacterium]|nr:hypothetical protein [Armatimonadota bacterium]
MLHQLSDKQWTVILKLRSNIRLEADLNLAKLEIHALLGQKPEDVYADDLEELIASELMNDYDRKFTTPYKTVAYRVDLQNADFAVLFRRLTFIEKVFGFRPIGQLSGALCNDQIKGVPAQFIDFRVIGGATLCVRLIPLNTILEWSDIFASRAANGKDAACGLRCAIACYLKNDPQFRWNPLIEKVFNTKITTGHLFHGLHVYKAKFFPRMARALINVFAPEEQPHIFDPYAGSGTAIVEASVMRMPAFGTDIDPLSVRISQAKMDLLNGRPSDYIGAILNVQDYLGVEKTGQFLLFENPIPAASYYTRIPPFLTKRIPPDIQQEMAHDISLALSAIARAPEHTRLPLKVLLSDAISRKLKFRFLGLGVGRFALNIMPGRIIDKFQDNLTYLQNSLVVWDWLKNAAAITPNTGHIVLGDARQLSFRESIFDFIITSPPYMPASSGRENYLKSKALALIALGLIKPDDIESYEQTQIGSVHREFYENDCLPSKAKEIVEWMAEDEVRSIKAPSTASFFSDMRHSLKEIRRVLKPSGICAMVVARSHTFYRYKSREIVRIVENAEAIAEIATLCGLEVKDTIHVELAKQNSVARPRSLDAYYESILILEKT